MNSNRCKSCVEFEKDLLAERKEKQFVLEELSQCKSDKEFVWSLWKRLQVSNPDLAQAISIVIKRENAKTEAKDRKILNLLQNKDEQIAALQNRMKLNTLNEVDCSSMKQVIENKVTKLNEEIEFLRLRLKSLESEKNQEKYEEIKLLNSQLNAELETLRFKLQNELEAKNSLQNENCLLNDKLHNLNPKLEEFEKAYRELELKDEENFANMETSKSEIISLKEDLKLKQCELDDCLAELKDLWKTHRETTEHAANQSLVIKKLQALQNDSNKVIANQETFNTTENVSLQKAYNELENRYTTSQDNLEKLNHEIQRLKSQLSEKDYSLSTLQIQLQNLCTLVSDETDTPEYLETNDFEEQIKLLEEKLKEKLKLENSELELGISMDEQTYQRKINILETKLYSTEKFLSLKTDEINVLKDAHNKRKDRLKSISNQYKLVKKQLRTYDQYEKDMHENKRRSRSLNRPLLSSLRRENAKEVWNELDILRKENKNLHMEQMNIQEKLDDYKVKCAQDAAKIHELQLCLQQEKEELNYKIKEAKFELESKGPPPHIVKRLKELESENCLMKDDVLNLKQEQNNLKEERDFLIEQSRMHKKEINKLKQDLTEKHLESVNLRNDLIICQRNIKKLNKRRSLISVSRTNFKKTQPSLVALSSIMDLPTDDDSNSANESESNICFKKFFKYKNDFIDEKPVKEIKLRNQSTSPIRMKESNKQAKSLKSQQNLSLNQRINSLIKQVSLLKQSKLALKISENNLRKQNEVLKADMNLVNQKLSTSKNSLYRLQCDIDRLKAEKENLVVKLEERNFGIDEQSNNDSIEMHTETEFNVLSAKLRAANCDIVKQNTQIKSLKSENVEKVEKILKLNEKISHLDRDLSAKKNLVEDLKNKLSKMETDSDKNKISELENKIENINQTCSRQKIQIDSLKMRLQIANNLKVEYEEKVTKLTDEIDKKNRQLSDTKRGKSKLELVVKDVEKAAENHMKDLASQSETALSSARQHLFSTENRISQYQRFIKTFANELLVSLYESRINLRKKQFESDENKKMFTNFSEIKHKAANILNLSHSDLEEILSGKESDESTMSIDTDPILRDEMKKDQRWLRRLQKIVKDQDFAFTLTQAFMEKVLEKCQICTLSESV